MTSDTTTGRSRLDIGAISGQRGGRRSSSGPIYGGGGGGIGPLLRTALLIIVTVVILVLVAKNCTGGDTSARDLQNETEAALVVAGFADLGVSVDGSTATLSGEVASESARRNAIANAKIVPGIEDVIDNLTIAAVADPGIDSGQGNGGAEVDAALQTALNQLVQGAPIQFASGSAEISDESITVLNQIAEAINATSGSVIEIGGHTDSKGDPEQNKILSQDRADSVRTYLVERGVESTRITTQGYGADQPVADNETPEGQAANRRIEFSVR